MAKQRFTKWAKLSKPAAPAPQAEGMSAYPITEGNSNWKYVGAAPAETAGPKEKEMDAVTYGTCAAEAHRIEGKPFLHTYMYTCQNWEARETAGEMTAEQFWAKWADENFGKYPDRQLPEMYLVEFAEAFAKQRVEQAERRIAKDRQLALENYASLGAKVADLERERDTLIDNLDRCNCGLDPKNDQFAPPWGHAPTCNYRVGLADKLLKMAPELREMREATDKLLAKAGKMSLSRSLVDTADLESLRLLARKAGS